MAMRVNGSGTPDLVLMNGKIRSRAHDVTVSEAVAVREGRFIAVGSSAGIQALAGPETRIEDLAGAAVIPGLIDIHNHLLATGQTLGQLRLYGSTSIDDIQSQVAERAAGTPPGNWIVGRGWDESLLAERRHPTRHDLDKVAPDHPVVLHRVWNKLVANSMALERAGISGMTPDPPADVPYAGWFERDADESPRGLFHDRAKTLITDAIPPATDDELVAAIGRACAAYHAIGLTAITEPGLTAPEMRAFQRAVRAGVLTIRSDLLMAGWGFVPAAEEQGLHDRIVAIGAETDFDSDLLRLAGVKLMPDGGIGDRTAKLHPTQQYLDEPGNHGTWVVDPGAIPEIVRWIHDRGWSIDSHTCGSLAQEVIVRAYAEATRANPAPRTHHRVHHAYFPTNETIQLMAEHGIAALISSPFIQNLGESFVAAVGEGMASQAMPTRRYLDAGVTLAGTSDSPVDDFNPWVGMQSLVMRQTATGRQFDREQSLTPAEALHAYTEGASQAVGQEHELGRIQAGYLADLVVLEQDVLAVPHETIGEVVPLATMVGGRFVFKRR